jgi:penicillin-binding protein 1C
VKRALAAIVLCCAPVAVNALPAYADVRAAYRPSDTLLLDRHGAPLQQVRIDAAVRRLP